MAFLDWLKPVPGWNAETAREFVQAHSPWEYIILDVRELHEYQESHVPGAIHVPLGILGDCLEGLDRSTTVLVCCSIGGRSTSATAMLRKAGFEKAFNLEGGFRSWKGLKTSFIKGMTSSVLRGAQSLEKLLALAWIVEDGTREFYRTLSNATPDGFARWAFQELEQDEVRHQRVVEDLFRTLLLQAPPAGFPYACLTHWNPEAMEGSLNLSEAVREASGKPLDESIKLAVAVETNALDLHLLMERKASEPEVRTMFRTLAGMEQRHIEKALALKNAAQDKS
ncbi:MAG: hypothetical protein A2498_09055 [Lentisphaerae bacterium RIFOXYC12_FULL_60_16]|nr:MAG: hypothetical protein A2498_09055 [Lentisphaerae bacterium RIFOXYC12_FULL_60_16]OGV86965.1 MAG: hypothetical protein A2340_14785 [Lentisphaerae bacterium RIFOXYB12_FULL_60_10]